MIQYLFSEVGNSLDGVSSETQAILLPVLVAALFASSFFFVQLLNNGGMGGGADMMAATGKNELLANLLKEYGPLLTFL